MLCFVTVGGLTIGFVDAITHFELQFLVEQNFFDVEFLIVARLVFVVDARVVVAVPASGKVERIVFVLIYAEFGLKCGGIKI